MIHSSQFLTRHQATGSRSTPSILVQKIASMTCYLASTIQSDNNPNIILHTNPHERLLVILKRGVSNLELSKAPSNSPVSGSLSPPYVSQSSFLLALRAS